VPANCSCRQSFPSMPSKAINPNAADSPNAADLQTTNLCHCPKTLYERELVKSFRHGIYKLSNIPR
jgi:hypothetical protein